MAEDTESLDDKKGTIIRKLINVSKMYSNMSVKDAEDEPPKPEPKAQRMSVWQAYVSQLQTLKLVRNDRLATLTGEQHHIIDMVSLVLNVPRDNIIEGLIDSDRHIELLDSLVIEGGRKAVLFYYQDMDAPPLSSGRHDPDLPAGTKIRRCIVTDGYSNEIENRAVIVYRIKGNVGIDLRNISDELFCTPIEYDPEKGTIVSSLWYLFDKTMSPSVNVLKDWVDLNKTTQGITYKDQFLCDFKSFNDFINATKVDLEGTLHFNYNPNLYDNWLNTVSGVKSAATKPEVVHEIEQIVRTWIKQIQLALIQSQQLRRENDTVGPLLELEYWRRQLAKFESIIEHLKSQKCQMHLNCLLISKSRIMKKWKEIDNQVTNACYEAKDNVKYLYALDKFCEPLYRTSPEKMGQALPAILYSTRMIYTTSRFFNTTERISALLVKMTNQIVNMCRHYLTDGGKRSVWKQAKCDVLKKVEVCLNLYTRYYYSYKKTKRDMVADEESPFDCSEMYIFGKFETFKKRIEKIVDVLETTIQYSILQNSTIEGIDEFANKFQEYFKDIASKKYDPLNHRKEDFNIDYKLFKDNISEAECQLHEFVKDKLNERPTVESAIRLLQRFDKLELPCLDIEERYLDVMQMLQREIEHIRDIYNEKRQEPIIPRNMPPVSGRIMWIRQLYRRMEAPMNILKTKDWVIKHRKAQKCIMMYNSLAMVFVHYEKIYHKAWFDFVAQVRLGLTMPLLIKHPKTRMYLINFDNYITETIREAEYMRRLKLDVPAIAQILIFCKGKLERSQEMVRSLVIINNKTRRSVPQLFLPLMRAYFFQIDVAFQPGLSTVNWTSLGIPDFCENVDEILDLVDKFVKKVKDTKEARIDEVLDHIASTLLIYLPDHPQAPSELVKANREHIDKMQKDIMKKSKSVETAVIELNKKFIDISQLTDENRYNWLDSERAMKPMSTELKTEGYDELKAFRDVDKTTINDMHAIHSDCMDLFMFFSQKNLDSLIKVTKYSLETLKRRCIHSYMEKEMPETLFLVDMELQIPNAVISPTIEEIQLHFSELLLSVINIHSGIEIWGAAPDAPEKSYFPLVSEHKDIIRAMMGMNGAMLLLKPDIQKLCSNYSQYAYLWAEDRETQITKFVATNPMIHAIQEEFELYEERTAKINDLADFQKLGPLQINMAKIKLGLLVESNAWKYLLGKHLSIKYKEKLTTMVDFINAHNKVLARKIKDLDDVRLGMKCLEEIRDNFIQMDMDLALMEEAYALFAKFNLDIPKEDVEGIDTLRYNFTNMIESSKKVQLNICEIQAPFQGDLITGVEIFRKDVEEFDRDYEQNGPMVEGLSAKEASDRVLLFQARFDDLWERYEMYSSGEKLFGMEVNEYPTLHQRKKEFNLLNKLYGLYLSVMKSIDGYFDLLWTDVDTEVIIAELTDFQNRCRKLPKGMKDWPAYLVLKQKIDDFNETCPLLELMANKAMKDRHWTRLSKLTGVKFEVESESFTLRNVMEAPLLEHKDDVEDICISAVKEKDIEAKLKQIIADWAIVFLSFAPFKTRGELLLKGQETSEIIAALEDSLMILNSLLSNRYNAPFKKDIQLWVNKLVITSEVLEKWMLVQNLWVYLEAVFVGGDISKQLPAEAKRFSGIDKSYVKIMLRAHEINNVVECCTGDETMAQLLPHLFEQLESCQKSLSGYLESKRLCFPRFFFISDPVLLEILGQSSDPHSIQPHLLSLFDAVYRVKFDDKQPDRIIEMGAEINEWVPLEKTVTASGGVEIWLNSLLNEVLGTVKNVIAQIALCFKAPDYDFIAGFMNFCGQAGLLGLQLLWTRDAEIALRKARVDRMIMRNTNQYFLNILNALIEITTRDLSKMDRVRCETMITIHLHQRDIFDDLVRLRIKSPIDFEWQKQARFYYIEDTDDVFVKITDVIFLYQNEYLGITERLCITPLTDRCYITLAQAIWMNMGGAPAGPAGTGKTETTKDMGRALGKFVVVFNCSDQMDFRGLGRIFKGLAQSGSWGCFDEFNRIELPVLSVAAQQIAIVLTARKDRKETFVFSDGDTVIMNPEFGIFLTMNPGYAGRQELPENLKIMFRSVAMMVPDRQIIIRVKLASCGFKENQILSRKFFTLYALCEEQLSKQVHYDFGLRNILSVLRTLGAQKRSNPSETEEAIVMRVLREMNVSKLIDEDEPLFVSLIDDMFPGLKLTSGVNKELQKAIANQSAEMVLVNHPDWNLKIVQLYDTSLVRHGLMTLGPTGAGKTTCIHCLMRCMTEMGRPHKEFRMNPKAITAPQMFGRLDVATNDWTDGIFSTLWRKTLKIKKSEFVWLVLDGPVDAVWIENLNSVLDDNKTLTLANGDRIVMAPNAKLVFEPDNVDNASPATISRMGMVFLSSSVLRWLPILDGWLKKRSRQENDVLRPLFLKIFDDLHTFIQTRLAAKMKILEALYIRQCCDLLEGLLLCSEDEIRTFTDKHLEHLYLFSLMWSLGAVLELLDREKMEHYVLKHPSKLAWPKVNPGETIFEYCVSEEGKWIHWSTQVEEYIYPPDSIPEYTSILVPNVDNVRTNFLIKTIAVQEKPVLLIGEQGTAKTVMMKGYMSCYDPEYQLSKSLNFSSATTPNMFQRILESYVDKRVGSTYGPPGGRKMTVFIDDVNMPIINEWGDQVTNEIVRQLMEMKGFYSLDKPGDFSTILDILIVAAMIHPGGGRNDIPPRLKRRFCIFNCTLPSNNSMDKIFQIIGEGYFCLSRFNEKVVEFVPLLISLTRRIWQQTKVKMLPTPAKFHYVFNLRDLSRIWQGMLTIQSLECQDETMVLKLWRHECTRVIADRFITADDREWFVNNLEKTAKEDLGEKFDFYTPEETFFVDFLREQIEATGDEPEDFCFDAPKIYEELPSYKFVLDKVHSFMEQFNETVRGALMDLVFFHDALVHLIIISRIVRTPRGSALLVGVGGSGKQSLTKLASFIAGYQYFQIQLTRTYNVNNLMDDLKYLYRIAGFEGKGISFIFTDNDITDESFLEFINNVLSSGEIANLFAKDELDEIQTELIPVMKKVDPKRVPTNDNLYDFFITRARSNLHIVLCFSPVGEKFRTRSLKFPGLISGCTMDWFSKWPMDALVAVSSHILSAFPIVCSPEVKTEVINMMGEVQNFVSDICVMYFDRFRRQTYVTPKSFLSFLQGYKSIYVERKVNIDQLAHKMVVGLEKLVEAAASVDVLRKELEVKEKDIAVASAKAEEVLAVVMTATDAAQKVKAEAESTKRKAEALVDIITVDQAQAEAKLEDARPALEAAEAALLTIKASDIATVRKLGKPPYLITLIMDAVLILFKKKIEFVKPDPEKQFLVASWSESLKVMADTRFLGYLQQYPKDTINAEICDLLIPYMTYPLYTYEAAKTACGNVAGLIQWTMSMVTFYGINKDVLPLKANLDRQKARYNIAQEELSSAMELLRTKEEEVAECQKEYDSAMSKKQLVLDDATKCKNKMDAATKLIDGLGGERIRWTEQSARFKSEIERLVGDVLLLTGFLSYAGPFNQEFRVMLQERWSSDLIKKKIPVTLNLNVTENLTDSATIGEWNLQGLPNDDLSIENGIIVTKASRFPLLIDPQIQGKIWISNKEAQFHLIVTSLNHKYFRQHIEDCVSLGYPMLVEDVLEELDPVLDNVLEKNFIKVGSSYKVKVGDKEVDVHKDFRMYITTKLPNPSYSPEVSARTSIIDFTVTMKGLEDQLLGRVIVTEKKELEIERTNLITDVTANKRKTKELEDNLLYKLTTTQGSLVDDETVIEVLNTTKNTAAEVNEKLVIARETEIKINAAREEFRPVATRGSNLYFLLTAMAEVNCMYQTSLVQFLERFDISMERSEKSPITSRRINFIIEYMTYEIFKYKCRGLYECHKYLFVLMLTLRIDLQRESITYEEFQNFIKSGAALDLNAVAPKPAAWIMDMTWLNLVQLSTLRQFQNIQQQVEANDRAWKNWFDREAPEEAIIPDGYHNLSTFHKLLMIRAWCPDRILAQSRKYVIDSMGPQFAEPVILNLEIMWEESRPLTPLINFLSMGSDPTPDIEALAKKLGFGIGAISLGQGQEVHAAKLIAISMSEGSWVLLQNCHLGLEYMNELMLLLVETEKTGLVHPDFRLWLTSEVHKSFPITLLQTCIKFTNEPPSGVRAGLKRTYSIMSQDMLEYSQVPQYLPIIYAVSFMHTVVQERRKFGPLGWNIPYEFNSADWLASCMFVQNHLEDLDPQRGISWTTVRYMFGEVQYGGRVTDDYDKRLLNTITRTWFGEHMFAENFCFFKGYRILSYKNLSDYLAEIEKMPAVDPPQVYGLHSNADITYQSNTATTMLNTILSIQPKESSVGGGETRESVVARLAKDMLDKTPPKYDPFEVKERLKAMGITSSMNIFLRQEIDRMQKIIITVKTTLSDLLLAIEGTIIMNEAIRDALDNIYDARIPKLWLRGSWASTTLGFWFTELLERNTQFSTWCFQGRPSVFWMTGFFNPQGFLTAMRQEVTRAHKGWALDSAVLHNEVTKFFKEDIKSAPSEGVYIHGLYLDGAGWDKRNCRLTEARNKVLYTLLPVVHAFAINSTGPKDPKLYTCPVYKKPVRTGLTYITPLWLPSLKLPDHWTMRGVALLCDIK